MQVIRPILVLASLLAGLFSFAQHPPIIPAPVKEEWQEGKFVLDPHTLIVADASDAPSANFFNDYLQQVYGFHLKVVGLDRRPASDFIRLENLAGKNTGVVPHAEGYYTLNAGAGS